MNNNETITYPEITGPFTVEDIELLRPDWDTTTLRRFLAEAGREASEGTARVVMDELEDTIARWEDAAECEPDAEYTDTILPVLDVPDILWCRKCDWIGTPAQSSYEERHGYACPECGSDGDTVRTYSPTEACELLARWQATPAMQDVAAKLAVVLADARGSLMKLNAPDTLSPARQYADLRAAVDELLRAAEILSATLVTDDLRGTAQFACDLDPANAAKVAAFNAALARFSTQYGEDAFPVVDTGGN